MLLKNKELLGIIIKRNLILIKVYILYYIMNWNIKLNGFIIIYLNELILLIISKGIWIRFNMIIRIEILSLVIDLNKQLKYIIKLYIDLILNIILWLEIMFY